jgi:hypothetical protein
MHPAALSSSCSKEKTMSALKIYFSSFLLPKSDSGPDECQDAISTPAGCEGAQQNEGAILQQGSPLRFAVADGVTTAFYSGFWASQLVSLFREGPMQNWACDGPAWKQAADEKWLEYIHTRELGSISQNRLVQRDSASATFCGIEITANTAENNELSWRVIAVGDSCVIHLSERYASASAPEEISFSHPCKKSSDFSCVTSAISNYEENRLPQEFTEQAPDQPVLMDGDILLLATDALCEWMLKLKESGHPVWKTIAEANDQEAFRRMVENARCELAPERRLKDDDVALIVIRVGDQPSAFISDSWVYVPGPPLPTRIASGDNSGFSSLFSAAVVADLHQEELPSQEPVTTEPKRQEPAESTQDSPTARKNWGGAIRSWLSKPSVEKFILTPGANITPQETDSDSNASASVPRPSEPGDSDAEETSAKNVNE